jgi:hypothetical protein
MTKILIRDSPKTYFDHNIIEWQKTESKYVTKVAENIKKANNIKGEFNYELTVPDDDGLFLIYGRLMAKVDPDAKKERFSLKTAQISLTSSFSKKVLNFLVSNMKDYFFNGQILVARGTIDHDSFIPSEIYTDSRIEKPRMISQLFNSRVCVATGPYFKNSLEEAAEVNAKVKEQNAELNIFLGPYITSNTELIMYKEPDLLVENAMEKLFSILSKDLTNCIFVSSMNDLFSIPVYPCRPLFEAESGNYTITKDPVFIEFGDLDLFVTSLDVFSVMAKQCDTEGSDRVKPQLIQLIHQCSICPVNMEGIQIDQINELTPFRQPHLYIYPTMAGSAFVQSEDNFAVRVKKLAVIEIVKGKIDVVLP